MPQTTEPDLPLYLACVAGRLSMATESPASSDMLALALAMLRLASFVSSSPCKSHAHRRESFADDRFLNRR